MNTWVEGPPRQKGPGCFARGCLILLVFAIVLGIYWLAKTHSIAEGPVPVPEFTGSDTQIQSVRERWQDFEQKTRAGQAAEIELAADDINAFIAANRNARGKVFVSIEGNQLRIQASTPL